MRRDNPVAVTVTKLLALLWTDEPSSRKTHAVLHRIPFCTSTETYVEEHFDDGKGHSNAFSSKRTPVLDTLFLVALEAQLIRGKLMPGYVSNTEYVITEKGMREAARLSNICRYALKRAERTGEIAPEHLMLVHPSSVSELLAIEILDTLANDGRLEAVSGSDKVSYRAKRRAA